MVSNRELFDYWYSQVRFKNETLIAAPGHVETFKLRHDCTNYDQLWKSPAVTQLPGLEQDRTVAVIKYVCTSRVLQRRSTLLRSKITEIEDSYEQLEAERSNFEKIIRRFQQVLFGKVKEAETLQAKIRTLTTENEALKVEAETSKAYTELLEKFETLQKAFEKESKRRKELGKKNQSLGGRVAHTRRFRKERDEARAILLEQKEQIAQLTQLNRTLETQNREMREQLSQLQPQQSLT
ncbi:hypothetical protein [Synechococcus sp. PCC 7335]|uniref:hypothetical protein n=1 Tax=Synechococcus sp. (strain ATCC 29403 / PCC 7335) TaxID=91464 RepID=UPI0002DAB6DA|nr:hypothetical protein [Synechococcus sp. PCC 7335]